MRIVEQSVQLMEDVDVDGEVILWKLEAACRTCYKSEGRNAERDLVKRDALIRNAIKSGHHSVLEHAAVTFRVITNRGVTHEWVRHRIGVAYSQESTRYCNYGNDKFGSEITVIWPWYLGQMPTQIRALIPGVAYPTSVFTAVAPAYVAWYEAMLAAETHYFNLLDLGRTAQEARGVLPNDLKTELVCTMNLRALRHFFELRCSTKAHPQIRALAAELKKTLQTLIPVVFEDLS